MSFFSKIGFFFNNVAYNLNVKKPDKLTEKLNYLESKMLYPYTGKFRTSKLRVMRLNIVEYNNLLAYMVEFDYDKRLFMDSISLTYNSDIAIANWFCVNGKTLTNVNELFKEWLTYSKRLIAVYNTFSITDTNPNIVSNFIHYKPYITNIEEVADLLIECVSS